MPQNFTMSDVQTIVRRKLNLNKEKSLYLIGNDGKSLMASSALLSEMFKKHGDADGFLYLMYTEENMFG